MRDPLEPIDGIDHRAWEHELLDEAENMKQGFTIPPTYDNSRVIRVDLEGTYPDTELVIETQWLFGERTTFIKRTRLWNSESWERVVDGRRHQVYPKAVVDAMALIVMEHQPSHDERPSRED